MEETFQGPVFVVGQPRSGTKLLRALINQHPRVRLLDVESNMLPWLALNWETFGDLSEPSVFTAFYAWCQDLIYFRNRRQRFGTVIDRDVWYHTCGIFDLASVFEALVRHDTGIPGGSDAIWGDKTPAYSVWLDVIAGIYPQARFIHIIRDVRDVCLSAQEAWGKHPLRNAQRWTDELAITREQGRDLGNAYLEVRFESLLADPRKELEAIAAFLGVAFDEAMLEAAEPTEEIGTARNQKSIVASVAGRWRRDLPERLRFGIEAIAGSRLEELGYDLPDGLPPQHRIHPWMLRLYRAFDGLHLAVLRVRTWGVVDSIRVGFRTFRTRNPSRG